MSMDVPARVLAALRWNTLAKLAAQLLNWGITIVVIRLLSPGDYGLMAMAGAFIALVAGFADAGLGGAVVQAQRVDRSQLQRVQGTALLGSAVVFLVLVACAPLIADFFAQERLTAIIQVSSVQFLIGAFVVVPNALLIRELKFKTTSLLEMVCGLSGGLVTLGLAWQGWGVWALVASSLTGGLLFAVAVNVLAPDRVWPVFSWRGIEKMLSFGGLNTLSTLLYRLNTQIDSLIAGRLLGQHTLGVYSVAMHLASLPSSKIGAIVGDVSGPAFSRLQSDRERVERSLGLAVALLGFAAFPAFFGISAIAPLAVQVLLGADWIEAVIPLTLVPLALPLRMIVSIVASAANALGYARVMLSHQLTFLLIMGPALLLGSRWSLLGLSLAWLIAYPVVFLLNIRRAASALQLSALRVLQPIWPSFASACTMYLVLLATRPFLERIAPGTALAALVTLGIASYAAATLMINRQGFDRFVTFGMRVVRPEA